MEQDKEQYRTVKNALFAVSNIAGRFFISSAVLFPDKKKLTIATYEDENEILAFYERIALQERMSIRLEIQKKISKNSSKEENLDVWGKDENVIMLYGVPIIKNNKEKLIEKAIIEFDTNKLANKDKIRLYQKLYGYEKKKSVKKTISKINKIGKNKENKENNEVYTYEGFLQKIGGRKIGKSAIIVDKVHLDLTKEFFAQFEIGIIVSKTYESINEGKDEDN